MTPDELKFPNRYVKFLSNYYLLFFLCKYGLLIRILLSSKVTQNWTTGLDR